MAVPGNSTNSLSESHDDIDFDSQTEMKFEQGGVAQRFPINGKRRNESILIPGKLFITENPMYGEYLEWKPLESRTPSPFNSGYPELHGTSNSGGIGFKPGKSDDESVEFLPDPREAEYRRPIKVELSELRSFLVTPKSLQREVIFFHSDGTILNTFVFERGSPENFITALERSVSIKKAKNGSKNLFMIGPKRETVQNPHGGVPGIPPSVAELFPDQMNQINHLWGFVKEFKNDPYATSCTALAKLAHNTLNGDIPGHFFHAKNEETSSGEQSPIKNGRHDDSMNSEGMDADYTTNEEGYEVIFKPENPGIDLPSRTETYRGQPLSQEQWLNYLDNDGRITNMEEIKKIIFQGGIDPTIRKHVWPLVLGVYDSASTYEERRHQFTEKICSYNRIKMQWATITEDQEERFFAFRDYKSLIEKDVNRTDRTLDYFAGDNSKGTDSLKNILMTYMMYNFNLGYVQGMSDILAPILMEIQDEILSFWLFVKFMERIHTNFEMSQEGMQNQLRDSYTLLQLVDPRFSAYLDACDASNMYFGFRWLLIWFKREFSYPDTLILWECMWTQLPGLNFQLFIGLAILVQHRNTVMSNKYGLSEILRHVNDLSMRINLELTLSMAEGMYLQVLAVQDKLPNNLRKIIGLPEIEEPEVSADNLEVLNGGYGDSSTSGRNSASSSRPLNTSKPRSSSINSRNGLTVPNDSDSSTANFPTSPDAEALESQYEIGVSQFM